MTAQENTPSPSDLNLTVNPDKLRLWWRRYRRAGCPFGQSLPGLQAWVRLCLQEGQTPAYDPQKEKR